MKVNTTISILLITACSAAAQSPQIIQSTKAKLQSAQQTWNAQQGAASSNAPAGLRSTNATQSGAYAVQARTPGVRQPTRGSAARCRNHRIPRMPRANFRRASRGPRRAKKNWLRTPDGTSTNAIPFSVRWCLASAGRDQVAQVASAVWRWTRSAYVESLRRKAA